jgi:hypothetical protein
MVQQFKFHEPNYISSLFGHFYPLEVNDVVSNIGASKQIDISDKMRLISLKSVQRFKFYEKNSISSLFGHFYPLEVNDVVPNIGASKQIDISDKMRLISFSGSNFMRKTPFLHFLAILEVNDSNFMQKNFMRKTPFLHFLALSIP